MAGSHSTGRWGRHIDGIMSEARATLARLPLRQVTLGGEPVDQSATTGSAADHDHVVVTHCGAENLSSRRRKTIMFWRYQGATDEHSSKRFRQV